MIQYLMIVSAFIAGALIYFALRSDIEESLFIKVEKNILFPVFIIILLVSGIYITESIHLSENAARSSNAQQRVNVMGCVIESAAECSLKANTLNNKASANIQNGTVQSADFYIPFSLVDVIAKNILTYFCAGVLLIWVIMFGKNLQVKQ